MLTRKNAYTLSDIGTYLKFHKDGTIEITALLTEEKSLLNVYSVMAVNTEQCKQTKQSMSKSTMTTQWTS